MQFSERLKELRKQKNWTQEDLANQLNITAASIGLYEQGRRMPDNNMLKKMASLFNVSIDYLVGFYFDGDNMSIDTNVGNQNILFPQFFYGGSSNPKKEELINLIINSDIPDHIIDLIKAAIEPYKK